jgi:pimeloyl-ACP methyl ester carboxylesterase/peroxiredoxin
MKTAILSIFLGLGLAGFGAPYAGERPQTARSDRQTAGPDSFYIQGHTALHARYPGRVISGEPVELSCTPDSVIHGPLRAILYIYDTTYQWRVTEYSLSGRGDGHWWVRFTVPGDAGLIAYRFVVGGRADNNADEGYFSMVYHEDGRFMAGAEAGYGLLRSPGYGRGVPGYFDHFSISDTATYMWLSNEILRQPGGRARLALPYLTADARYKPERAPSEMARAVTYFSARPDSSGENWLTAYLICVRLLHDTLRGDSLRGAILARYPQGALARLEAFNTVMHGNPRDGAPAAAFLKAFPYDFAAGTGSADESAYTSESAAESAYIAGQQNELLGIRYPAVYRRLLMTAIARGDRGVILQYRRTLPFDNLTEAYYKAVEIPYDDWKTENAATVYPYAEALYQRMQFYIGHQPAEYWYYAPSEWQVYCAALFKQVYRLQARILLDLGRQQEALALARRAQLSYACSSADLNETEALLLQKLGQTAALDSLLRAAVRENQATPAIIGMLRERYRLAHGDGGARADGRGDAGFDAWFESLKDAHTREVMLKEVREMQVHLSTPAVAFTDASGRSVRLNDYRGKTVVLDFWATWCAPCKAAMAGMNMVAGKYAGDTGVVFLFVDTQERLADYKEKGRSFLQSKGYDLTVVYDEGVEMDSAYKAFASLIHTSGIPFKVVIDPGGVLRFANIGYKGSPSGLADEMQAMIELARKGRPYRSEDVTYMDDTIRIGATLTYPLGPGTGTAVILLSGTGKQDRDGTMAGHPLFAVLADSLTRRGFTVLRSDDRGVGESGGNYERSTTQDFAADAIAAVSYLAGRTDLGLRRIGLLGHSEGGMAASLAAARDSCIAFVITLSSPGTTGLEALLLQNRTLVHRAAIPEINKLRFDSVNHLLFTLVYDYADSSDLEHRIRAASAQWKIWDDSLVAANHLADGGHFFFPLESYIRQATGAWYRFFLRYDPRVVLREVHVPFLAINGDRDVISDGRVNLAGIASALAAGGNTRVTTWLACGLNHLYQHCKTCEPTEYASLPETIAPEVVTRVAEWLSALAVTFGTAQTS